MDEEFLDRYSKYRKDEQEKSLQGLRLQWMIKKKKALEPAYLLWIGI